MVPLSVINNPTNTLSLLGAVIALHCCNIAKVEQLKRTVLMAVTSCMTMHCNGANFGNCINGGMLLNQTPFKLWNSSLNQA